MQTRPFPVNTANVIVHRERKQFLNPLQILLTEKLMVVIEHAIEFQPIAVKAQMELESRQPWAGENIGGPAAKVPERGYKATGQTIIIGYTVGNF